MCRRLDLADEKEAKRLFREVRLDIGRLDVLVNNAGAIEDGFVLMMSVRSSRNRPHQPHGHVHRQP